MEDLCNNYEIKSIDFIKSLFDEDSGLGMDCEQFQDSPSFCQSREFHNKRKRQDASLDSPVSYSKKRCLKLKTRNRLTKSLSFDFQMLNSNDNSHMTSLSATENMAVEGNVLIGDGSKECSLPTIQGGCHDLRYITSSTLTDLLEGKFDGVVGSFRIIDCRYSYEFDGGHIRGAENIHNKDDILELFKTASARSDGKRNIIIFHCEFSSERGPKMCRFLRNHDREINAENYPALTFPELYILKGGYKEFYESSNKTFCTPMNYVPMLSKDHKDDLRHFRCKSKSWFAGQKRLKSGSRLFC